MSKRVLLTEAQIARFIKAVSRAHPDLSRVRLTPQGDVVIEREDGTPVKTAHYGRLDLTGR